MENIIKIPIGEKIVVLKSEDWDDEVVDMDEISKIDYSNLFGELVTVSALLNKVGILRADAEHNVNDFKLQLSIFESQTRKGIIREALAAGMKKPSESSIDDDVNTNAKVIAMRKRFNEIQRDYNYIDALYWAVQSKDKKLSVLLKGVTPEEFADGIVEGVVNTFMVKKFDKTL